MNNDDENLVQYGYNSFDDKKHVTCVYIDYSKAFDTIDHNIFCKKLEKFVFGYNEINWCKHYLGCRKQCVKLSGVLSSALDVSCGIPQGSILGPLFFIMYTYVNDLLMNFENCDVNILLYADKVVYHAHEDAITACNIIENKLKDIE